MDYLSLKMSSGNDHPNLDCTDLKIALKKKVKPKEAKLKI